MYHYSRIITMFAVLNIYNEPNAGCQLAFTVQAFFMPGHIVYHIWYPCTPMWSVNAPTAFGLNVLSNGKGTDTFILKTNCLCSTIQTTLILQCLAASERPPTKRASVCRCRHSTATPYVIIPPPPEHVNVNRQLRPPCASHWSKPYWMHIPVSGASRSKIVVSCFRLALGSMADAWCTSRLTPCITCVTCSANKFGVYWAKPNPSYLHIIFLVRLAQAGRTGISHTKKTKLSL